MKLLIIGSGGVGTSAAMLIKNAGGWAEKIVLADYDEARARKAAERAGGGRFLAEKIDASNPASVAGVIKKHGIDFTLNAVEPAFNESVFDACLNSGSGYMDCAMTLSEPHPEKPFSLPGVKLGDAQFARSSEWEKRGLLALVGSGVEPGMADVFARFAADRLFDTVDEVNIRDGDNYTEGGVFGFSVWTTIEECLNPPIVWEKGRGWFTTERFSEPEIFNFPGGIGNVEVVNVEHEEVLLVPRVIDCNRVTFKYGVPRETRALLLDLEKAGMTSRHTKISFRGIEASPRDFFVKAAPNPIETSAAMKGKGCAGTWVTGVKDGKQRSVYLYQVADNAECVKKYGTNSVVAQTAAGPVIMLELIANGVWGGRGVFGPESFDPLPFVSRLASYGFPAGMREMDSEYAMSLEQNNLAKLVQAEVL